MQVANRTAVVPVTRSSESSAASSVPIALKAILQRIANSTGLSLAQKRSFAEAIKNAFETGNGKLMVKIMMAVAQAEAQNAQRAGGQYSRHTLDDILTTGQTDSSTPTLDTTQLLSGQDRIRQLLFS